ncbi:ATP-grasp domain-containing protein [Asticcacaulis solisilvae]|uniref:ATP-grasp domain-containing protein n=1 Tax=Asticcacaulis solisilvae TaxID=1217274 RepID=UPI003FD8F6D5
MSRIVITGARAPVTRDVAHALADAGHKVHLADVFRTRTAGRFSWHAYAAPVQEPARFASDVAGLNASLQPDLIIPLCEEVFHLASLPGLPLFAPDIKTLLRLHSKMDFIQWAQSLGLDAPHTRPAGPGGADNAASSVFKPEFSRFGAHCLIRPTPEAVRKLVHAPSNPWLRQDFIAGDDLCFHAIARQGRVRAFAAYRSDWRTSGGASYYFEPLPDPLSQRLLAIAETLAEAGRITGQIACDVRHDADDRLWLIECNPRGTSGLHLLAHNPAALAKAFLSDGDTVLTGVDRPVCLGPAMRLFGWPKALGSGRIPQWQRDFGRARDALSGCAWGATMDSLLHGLRAAARGKTLPQVLTEDIEYNGHAHVG